MMNDSDYCKGFLTGCVCIVSAYTYYLFVSLLIYTGDLRINNDSTKIFGIFFILFVTPIYCVTYNNILEDWSHSRKERQNSFYNRRIIACDEDFNEEWITSMTGANGDECTKEKFVLSLLVKYNILNMKYDVDPLMKVVSILNCFSPLKSVIFFLTEIR
jgi:hypothetical protein